jgi:hypothetical protein
MTRSIVHGSARFVVPYLDSRDAFCHLLGNCGATTHNMLIAAANEEVCVTVNKYYSYMCNVTLCHIKCRIIELRLWSNLRMVGRYFLLMEVFINISYVTACFIT